MKSIQLQTIAQFKISTRRHNTDHLLFSTILCRILAKIIQYETFNVWAVLSAFIHLPGMFLSSESLFEQRIWHAIIDLLYIRFTADKYITCLYVTGIYTWDDQHTVIQISRLYDQPRFRWYHHNCHYALILVVNRVTPEVLIIIAYKWKSYPTTFPQKRNASYLVSH